MDVKSCLDTHIEFVLGRKWLTILLCLAVMMACAMKVGSLTNSRDFRDLFSKDNPELLAYDRLNDIYAHASSNMVLIAVAPQTGTTFTREALGVIETLTERAWLLPYAGRVDSLTNFSHSRADGDDLIIEPLVEDSKALTDDDLGRISEIALDTPELRNRLVAGDGRVGGLLINFAIPEERSAAIDEVNDHLESMIDEIRKERPGIDLHAVGEIVSNRAFTQTTESELQFLIPLSFLVILMVSWMLTRSLFCPLAVLFLIVFTTGTTMGIAGWFGVVLTPISAYIPIVVMAITVAYSIHIITGTLAGLRKGLTKPDAIASSIRANIYPVFLTSLTTAIGFVSLNFSDLPPFRTLGNFVAIGVLFNFLYSLTLLPALLAVLGLRAAPRRAGESDRYLRLADFVISNRRMLLLGTTAIAVVCSAGILRIELSDNFVKYYGPGHEFRRDMEFVIDNFTGLDTQEYSLDTGQESGITDPDYLETIDKFAQWYRQQPGVHHVWSFSDIIKRLNRNMNGDDPKYYKLPTEGALAAQYLLLYELSLPFGQDLNNSINISKSATRMVVTLRNLSSREQRELAERGYDWLESNAPDLAARPSGFSVILTYLAERSVRSMLSGTAIAVMVVSMLLLLVFRSVRYGLVSLVPNFVPGIMAVGLWGYFFGNIGMAAAVFIVISFGIVVDDTIHFLSRYLKARRGNGALPPDAVREAFGSTGRALWTTTAVLMLGFGVFAFSGFQPNWSLGGLVTISIGLALALDFLLLPPLLMLVDGARADRKEASAGPTR